MGLGRSKIKLTDIDVDGNGIITREEVHNYVNDEVNKWKDIYDEKLNQWKDLYEEKLQVKDETIRELQTLLEARIYEKKQEVEDWKTLYDELYAKHSELLEKFRKKAYNDPKVIQSTSNISSEAIEAAVEEILADPKLNLKKVPDWMEKKVYHNLIWVMLMVVEKIIASVKFDTLGHEFSLTMIPKEIS